MPHVDSRQFDIVLIEDTVWIVTTPIGVPNYDFSFQTFFACRHPWQRPEQITAIGRFGASNDYASLYKDLTTEGVHLIHTPEQYTLASELPYWYPIIQDLTPRSVWFDTPPPVETIEQMFIWPVFLKGARQTSRHKAALSIIHSPDEYAIAIDHYQRNPILHWQSLVCREFIALRPVSAQTTDVIPPAFEFRTFWYYGECVGFGPYWAAFASYEYTQAEKQAALATAYIAVQRLNLPFLVVDVAQTQAGDWIVIECNDGQESGYAGIPPIPLWQRVIEIERNKV